MYPFPYIGDFTNNLRGCKFFSKLDLVKGYNEVPMSEADICKTAIVTSFGMFEFLYMPFGLKNATQTFQRLMDTIFRGLRRCPTPPTTSPGCTWSPAVFRIHIILIWIQIRIRIQGNF